MNKIRKIRYILCCLLAVGIMGCSDDDNNIGRILYQFQYT